MPDLIRHPQLFEINRLLVEFCASLRVPDEQRLPSREYVEMSDSHFGFVKCSEPKKNGVVW